MAFTRINVKKKLQSLGVKIEGNYYVRKRVTSGYYSSLGGQCFDDYMRGIEETYLENIPELKDININFEGDYPNLYCIFNVVSKQNKKLTKKYKVHVDESALDDDELEDRDAFVGYAMTSLPNEHEGGEWMKQDEKDFYEMFPSLRKL